jgi:hypothetical protein
MLFFHFKRNILTASQKSQLTKVKLFIGHSLSQKKSSRQWRGESQINFIQSNFLQGPKDNQLITYSQSRSSQITRNN